jgi:hypothetical protein
MSLKVNQSDIFELYRARGFQKHVPQVCGIAKKKLYFFGQSDLGHMGL